MSSDVAISVRGLSKSYTIRHTQQRHTTLGEALVHRVKHPFERPEREEFWALDGVSFDVKQGEVLGVIGRNGAGKSTLLKVLSRITAPTKGEVHLYGRVGSLLEVGTGFHPELTGRENIYLNGSILGMRRREIDRRFDEIVDFGGIEKFLDTPVKRYSSGMYVRLAFAVAAHLDTDILLVDEVLAVGDTSFQAKALGRMQELSGDDGRAVVLVTHQLALVESAATRALLIANGEAVHEGSPRAVIGTYAHPQPDASSVPKGRLGRLVTSVEVSDGTGNSAVRIGGPVRVEVSGDAPGIDRPIIGIRITTASGTPVVGLNSQMCGPPLDVEGPWHVQFDIPALPLIHGTYYLDVAVHDRMNTVVELIDNAASFDVEASDVFGSGRLPEPGQTLIAVPARFSVSQR